MAPAHSPPIGWLGEQGGARERSCHPPDLARRGQNQTTKEGQQGVRYFI